MVETEEMLIIAVKPPYDFVTDQGQRLVGFKVVAVPIGLLSDNPNYRGLIMTDISFSNVSLHGLFEKVPGIYNIGYQTAFSVNGKRSRKAVSVEFVRDPELSDFSASGCIFI